jgi:HlyD family secretion protein
VRTLIVSLVVVLVVSGIGAGVYYARRGDTRPEVMSAPVTRGDIVESVSATGTLEAVTTVQVGTQVSGIIQALYADYNSIVRKGQVIARLDPSLFQTQIDQQRANLTRSEAEVERLRVQVDDARTKLTRAQGLADKQLIPASELETAEVTLRAAQAQLQSAQAQVTQSRASLNQAQVNLRHTVIEAPIDGIVISRNVDVGQTVAASMQAPTLFVIAADLTKMKVNANIDEADVGRIRPEQHVIFRVDAFPADDFEGTVSQIRLQPTTVQNVVTYATVIDVPNRELKLKPGMTANVSIEIARRTDVLRVPNLALRFRPTTDIFAALGQEPPEDFNRAARPARSGGTGTSPAAPAPASGNSTVPRPRGTSGQGSAMATDGQPTPEGQTRPGTGAPDPERRRRAMERLQSLPPEERERAIERLRQSDRGQGQQAPPSAAARQQSASGSPPRAAGAGSPQTIDALFGPLPPSETSGRVWRFVDGRLTPVRVRLGVTDGTNTELIEGGLLEGAPLVTGVLLQPTPAATQGGARSSSPLIPQRGPGSRR